MLLSWNVNGLRAALGRGVLDLVRSGRYDILMFQEVKADSVPLDLQMSGYEAYMATSRRRGATAAS